MPILPGPVSKAAKETMWARLRPRRRPAEQRLGSFEARRRDPAPAFSSQRRLPIVSLTRPAFWLAPRFAGAARAGIARSFPVTAAIAVLTGPRRSFPAPEPGRRSGRE